MNYEQLENEYKAQLELPLKTAIPTITVELEPEFENENTPVATNPRVTIFLDQSEFGKSKATSHISQDEEIKAFLLVRARKLRGEGGIYHIMEHIRAALVGFTPTGFKRVWLVKIAFEKRDRNVWYYTAVVATASMIVEDHTPPTAPKLTSPTADFVDNNYNN